jgi:4'-phosphopantetheinyl transferase
LTQQLALENRVEIWIAEPPRVTAPELLAAYDQLLSDSERARQRGLLLEKNRHERLVAGALLRTTLSEHAATRPADWRFSTNAHGRPAIEPASALRFSLAHHPTLVVCAVSGGPELGVDVEPLQRADEMLAVAQRSFAPKELAELRALPAAAARERAVSLWTLKEAYIKARGLGLSLPLDGFALSFDAAEPTIAFGPAVTDRPERWAFRTYDVKGHRIALAVEQWRGVPEIRLRFTIPLSGVVSAQPLE